MSHPLKIGNNSCFSRQWNPDASQAAIYTFRHVFCSFLANRAKEKVSAFQVMKLMGHGSMEIVLTYFPANNRGLAAAVSGVDFGAMLQVAAKGKSSRISAK